MLYPRDQDADRRDGAGELGDYLEFGVFNGRSMACMHRVLRDLDLPHVRLLGFDSFEGLPESAREDDGGAWQPGWFRSDIEITRELLTDVGVDWSRTHLIKGWFSDTCTPATAAQYGVRKASLIMVDCDTYRSTCEALQFVDPLIGDAAVLFFDDWGSLDLDKQHGRETRVRRVPPRLSALPG